MFSRPLKKSCHSCESRNLLRLSVVFCLLFFVFSASCGGLSSSSDDEYDVSVPTQALPYISRVDPANGGAGTVVTVYGLGFSVEPANNIVIIGGDSVAAESYSLAANPTGGEAEMLTFTVPAGASPGTVAVNIVVFENTSNGDVAFEIE